MYLEFQYEFNVWPTVSETPVSSETEQNVFRTTAFLTTGTLKIYVDTTPIVTISNNFRRWKKRFAGNYANNCWKADGFSAADITTHHQPQSSCKLQIRRNSVPQATQSTTSRHHSLDWIDWTYGMGMDVAYIIEELAKIRVAKDICRIIRSPHGRPRHDFQFSCQ